MINVPLALQHLITVHNKSLLEYQQILLSEINEANFEIMKMLNLDPSDGWYLDMNTMQYIQQVESSDGAE